MKVKALKHYFLYTSIDILTIPKDLYKIHVENIIFAVNKKVTKYLLFWKECNELLLIRYLILNVKVPLQLLVTAI